MTAKCNYIAILVCFAISLWAGPAPASIIQCDQALGTESAHSILEGLDIPTLPADLQLAWKDTNFTDPNFHTSSYRYRVIALQGQSYGTAKSLSILDTFMNDDFVNSSEIVSFSVIDDSKNPTWGMSGFIISVPPENIISMRESDMVTGRLSWETTPEGRQNRIRETVSKGSSPEDPMSLIDHTEARFGEAIGHNEVAALSKGKTGGKIALKGVFLKEDSLGNSLISEALETRLREVARLKKLPVVKLPPPSSVQIIRAVAVSDGIIRLSCNHQKFSSMMQKNIPIFAMVPSDMPGEPNKIISLSNLDGTLEFPIAHRVHYSIYFQQ